MAPWACGLHAAARARNAPTCDGVQHSTSTAQHSTSSTRLLAGTRQPSTVEPALHCKARCSCRSVECRRVAVGGGRWAVGGRRCWQPAVHTLCIHTHTYAHLVRRRATAQSDLRCICAQLAATRSAAVGPRCAVDLSALAAGQSGRGAGGINGIFPPHAALLARSPICAASQSPPAVSLARLYTKRQRSTTQPAQWPLPTGIRCAHAASAV